MTSLFTILFLTVAPPRVTSVLVFPDRAQVTRAQSIECGPRAQVAFPAIPPGADTSTFRAKTSAGTVEGLRFEERTRREAFAPEVTSLEAKIRDIDTELRALHDAIAIDSANRGTAKNYSDAAVSLISREMVEPLPNVKGWDQAFNVALDVRQKTAARDADREVKIRALQFKRIDLEDKRQRLSQAGSRSEFLAEVLVTCPEGKTAKVELTYVVGGSSWEPAYEARADEKSGEVELSTWATVRQATGEDWKGIDVTLSTAVPRQNATPPEVRPLKIYAEEKKAEKKILVRRDEYQAHAESAGPSGAAAPQGMRATSQGLSVQLAVPETADIPGDGSPARVLVAKTRMKAQFAERTVPKLVPFVFRVADLNNAAPFPLLPGMLDAFRKNGLIGRTQLERVAEGERFHLTFGVEEAVKVKRLVVEEVVRDKGFLGSTRRFRYSYRYEVANYSEAAQVVEISEPVPVSEMEDVKVGIDEKTTGGYELRAADGIVLWKVKVGVGEKKTVDLLFHVDVPSSYDSGGI